MKKVILLFLLSFCAHFVYGQTERKFGFYLNICNNVTVYDRHIAGNSVGPGLNLDLYLYTKSKIKPKLELNFSAFFSDKIAISDTNGNLYVDKHGPPCLFLGPSFDFFNRLEFSITAGPSLVNSDLYFGIKPNITLYIDKKKKIKCEISLTNIFQRDKASNKPFGFISCGIGIKLH